MDWPRLSFLSMFFMFCAGVGVAFAFVWFVYGDLMWATMNAGAVVLSIICGLITR